MRKKFAFVDLDGVLFNIAAFKKRYFEFLVSIFDAADATEEVLTSYEASKEMGWYNVDRHIALLSAISLPACAIRSRIDDFMHNEAKQFMYPDAAMFLRRLSDLGYETRIATAGVEWFQEEKIGIQFLRHIVGVFTTGDPTKTSVIGRFADPEKDDIVLFDDTTRVIDWVKEFFPKVCAVQVRRDSWDGASDKADFHVSNLEEAFDLLRLPLP